MNENRFYRPADLQIREQAEPEQKSYIVEGYASTFQPYVLWKDPETEIEYIEQIDTKAFEDTDMSDVVFRVDHEGPVYARTKNGLIELSVDDHGLFCRVDLGQTEKARALYEDIKVGNYFQMSFAFTVSADNYDQKTHTRTIFGIDKLYDVAPVSFPANPTTEIDIATRSFLNGAIEAETAERLRVEHRNRMKEQLLLKIKLSEVEG